MATFREKPVEVEAVRFAGDNWAEMHAFTGHVDVRGRPTDAFREVAQPANIQAEVYDGLRLTWVGVKVGQWVMRGARGEYYPREDDGTGLAPLGYEPA
jgi:hypothetical protein